MKVGEKNIFFDIMVSIVFMVPLLLGGCGGSVQEKLESEVKPAQQEALHPLRDVKWGVTKETFDWLTANFETKPYVTKIDQMSGECPVLLAALRNRNVEWVESQIHSNDFSDPRFEPFKVQYPWMIESASKSLKEIPFEQSTEGAEPGDREINVTPTSNFALYGIDIDGDLMDEMIFYGEYLVGADLKGSGITYFSKRYGASQYIVISNGVGAALKTMSFETDKRNSFEGYSSVIRYRTRYFIVEVSGGKNIFKATIDELGKFYGYENHVMLTKPRCEFLVQ